MGSAYKLNLEASEEEIKNIYKQIDGGSWKGNYFYADGKLGNLHTWIYDELSPDFHVLVYDFELTEDLIFEDPVKTEHLITIKFTIDATITLGNDEREVGAGQSDGIIIYNSAQRMRTFVKSGQKLKGVTIRVTEDYWKKVANAKWPEMEALVANKAPWLFYESMSVEMGDCIKQLFSYQQVPSGRTGFTLAKSFELLTYFFIQLSKNNTSRGTVGMLQQDVDMVFQIKDLLDRQLSDPPSVKELSAKFGRSIGKIRSDFLKVFAMTPHDYMMRERLKLSLVDLKSTNKTVSEISYDYGFTDTSYFVKCFKKQYATTPLVYRKKIMK